MLPHLVSLMLAIPMGLDKTLSALHDKLSPSPHAKAALDAKVAMMAEMNAPNHRSKAMEKNVGLQSIHDSAKNNASSSLSTSYDAYNILKEKCVACKLAEDALTSQLEVVISFHTTADEKLTEYNSAKSAAETASSTAATLEGERDNKCGADNAGPPKEVDGWWKCKNYVSESPGSLNFLSFTGTLEEAASKCQEVQCTHLEKDDGIDGKYYFCADGIENGSYAVYEA